MPSADMSRPWRPTIAPPKGEKSNDVIYRNDMLSGRKKSLKMKQQAHEGHGLHTELSAVVSPLLRPSLPPGWYPPPGLDPPLGLELPEAVDSEKPEALPTPVQQPEPETEQFKVLLQNLPEAMLKECMLRVMLEEAKLKDVVHLAFYTSGGKALITLSSYESVVRCVKHFRGRQWGSSNAPVEATRVKTPGAKKPVQEFTISADAPVFVPGAKQRTSSTLSAASVLSAEAPVFVPSCEKIVRDRFFSYASTDVGSTSEKGSDGCESEAEAQAVCA